MHPIDCPVADGRTYEDIVAQIAALAPHYTPHWRLGDRPDVGGALMRIFAMQLAGTVARFDQMPLNHKLSFYNMLGGHRRPARPAFGAVCFQLSGPDAPGSLLPRNFKLFSPPVDDEGLRLVFETQQPLSVGSAQITSLIYVNPETDTVCFGQEGRIDSGASSGRSSHRLTFTHRFLNALPPQSQLRLYTDSRDNERWHARLCDPALARWSAEGHEIACVETDTLQLCGLPPRNEASDTEITLEPLDIAAFETLPLDGLRLRTEGENIPPDAVYVKGERQEEVRFDAFGRSPAVYDDLVFVSNTVLAQSGAEITLSFTLGFEVVFEGEQPPLRLPKRLVVRKSEVELPRRRDVVVSDVVFEYWNGAGFVPLRHGTPKTLFGGLDTFGEVKSDCLCQISFVCPGDMAPLLVGGYESLCVRARIRGIDNQFALPARVLLPWIGAPAFSYRYTRPEPVTLYRLENNGVSAEMTELPAYPFTRPRETSPALYIGWDRPLSGEIGLLAVCESTAGAEGGVSLSALSSEGAVALPVRDCTAGLCRSGVLSFTLGNEMGFRRVYGRDGYWLRLALSDHQPVKLCGLYPNAVQVIQCDSTTTFTSDTELSRLRLQHPNILDLTVYKNTAGPQTGPGEEIWSELSEWADYTIDKSNGLITFTQKLTFRTNGRTVKVSYRHGGGRAGNLPALSEFIPALQAGYVQKAVNPLPMGGGTQEESFEAAQLRMGRRIRHGDRALAREDYEELVRDADIAGVWCECREGQVTLVLLTDDPNIPFDAVRTRTLDTLRLSLPLGLPEPVVCPPAFVTVSVDATLTLEPDCVDLTEAEQTIRATCDPYQWARTAGLGKLPNSGLLYRLLLSLLSVRGVSGLKVHYHLGATEITTPPPYALPVCGKVSLWMAESAGRRGMDHAPTH